ncbi:MAG: hypothetical protein K0S92_953, partial [Desertimonas sp.]|nr:hypothetical protein [Desertimonas sp.]
MAGVTPGPCDDDVGRVRVGVLGCGNVGGP